MSKGKSLFFITLIISLLTSCGHYVRESGFVENDWPKNSYYTPRELQIWNKPRIEIGSSCDGTNYTATWGPYIALPLFVIPNPFWPFTYYHHTTKVAALSLLISSPTTTFDWNTVSTKLVLNGRQLELTHIADISKSDAQYRRYSYRSGLTCKALDDSELEIDVDGPPQMSMKAKVLYKHRWRASFEGI